MSKISFNKPITDTIQILKKVFDELEISAYLIGAQARDVWFLPKRSPRITQDIDWVIAHSNEDLFKELKKTLIENEGFTQMRNPLKLLSPHKIEVDLIPFDYPETPHFVGLHEIFERGTEGVTFDDGTTHRVATLPSIVLLKLIAWADKPEYRSKDVDDINYILEHFDIYVDDCFILFTEIEPEFISARTVGRKISHILGDSIALKNHIIKVLENQISQPDESKFIQIILNKSEKTAEFIVTQVKEMLIGLQETPPQ